MCNSKHTPLWQQAIGSALLAILPTTGLAAQGGDSDESKFHRVVLERVTFRSSERVPLFAEHQLENVIPAALAGKDIPISIRGKQLVVDIDGSGKAVRRLSRPEVLEIGTRSRISQVLLYRKLSHWYACSGNAYTAKVDKTTVVFLDTDLDDKLRPNTDLVRVGKGAFGPHHQNGLLWTGKRMITYRIDPEAETPTLLWRKQEGSRFEQAKPNIVLDKLNDLRTSIGVQPLIADTDLAHACYLHLNYVLANVPDGLKRSEFQKAAQEHRRELASKPGFTRLGRDAGKNGFMDFAKKPEVLFQPGRWGMAADRFRIIARESRRLGVSMAAFVYQIWIPLGRPRRSSLPIFLPAPGQEEVPTLSRKHDLAPDQQPRFYDQPRGFPITVHRLDGWTDTDLELSLARGGKTVDALFFSPEAPLKASYASNYNAQMLIPTKPLKRRKLYRVTLTGTHRGQPRTFSWTFKTGK